MPVGPSRHRKESWVLELIAINNKPPTRTVPHFLLLSTDPHKSIKDNIKDACALASQNERSFTFCPVLTVFKSFIFHI